MTTATFNLARTLPPWGTMVAAACGAFYAFKLITYRGAAHELVMHEDAPSLLRKLGYFLAWPGLDAVTFLSPRKPTTRPTRLAWLQAGAMTLLGAAIFLAATWCAVQPSLATHYTLLIGWLGMVGMVTSFHFGLFRLAALAWRSAGVVAEPIMDRPLAAANLSEFWERRWNKAFRDLAHRHVVAPLVRRLGPRGALVAGFTFSGLVHELCISFPAGGGYGMPLLYFWIQAGAILFTRSTFGTRLGLRRGLKARFYAGVVLAAPLPLLFHEPFVRRVIVPLLQTISVF
jgi:hypothetical protein